MLRFCTSQLDSWTKDVKRKDHTLKATTAIKKKQASHEFSPTLATVTVEVVLQLPPVRSLVHASQDAAPTPSDTATPAPATSPSKRIASSDYRSWDNFDVVSLIDSYCIPSSQAVCRRVS
jgi:hypothetical protein